MRRCNNCASPATFGRIKCAWHLARDRSYHRRRAGTRQRKQISLHALLAEVQRVAGKLKTSRLSSTHFERHGRIEWTNRLRHRFGTWAEVCVLAGLEKPWRGMRGLDTRPCRRCGKRCSWYGPATIWCWACRKIVRKRKTVRAWDEDAA